MQQTGRQVPKVIAGALAVLTFGFVFAPDEAAAQVQPWEDSGYVSLNYGYEVANRSFSESLSATVYDETATYTADHAGSGGGGFDIGAGWRFWRNLAAGVTVTSFSTSSGAAVSGSIVTGSMTPIFPNIQWRWTYTTIGCTSPNTRHRIRSIRPPRRW